MSLTGAAIQGKGRYGTPSAGRHSRRSSSPRVSSISGHTSIPRFLYCFMLNRQFPYFSTGMEFFKSFLPYQGGLIAYASAFLSQLYHLPLAGVVDHHLGCGFPLPGDGWASSSISAARACARSTMSPLILMLILCSQLQTCIGRRSCSSDGAVARNLYMRLTPRNWWLAAAAFVALFGRGLLFDGGRMPDVCGIVRDLRVSAPEGGFCSERSSCCWHRSLCFSPDDTSSELI